MLVSQAIPVEIKSFKFGFINIHMSYSPIFQLIINHNSRLLFMKATKSKDKTVLKRDWFDLSNKGDVQKLLGEENVDQELIPKLCNCDICTQHQN